MKNLNGHAAGIISEELRSPRLGSGVERFRERRVDQSLLPGTTMDQRFFEHAFMSCSALAIMGCVLSANAKPTLLNLEQTLTASW
jgi:hypothetical protein